MSTRRKMVEVFPTPGAKIEQIDMGEFECPACNGRGVVVSSTTPYTTEYAACGFCKGSGKIYASVSINWISK